MRLFLLAEAEADRAIPSFVRGRENRPVLCEDDEGVRPAEFPAEPGEGAGPILFPAVMLEEPQPCQLRVSVRLETLKVLSDQRLTVFRIRNCAVLCDAQLSLNVHWMGVLHVRAPLGRV